MSDAFFATVVVITNIPTPYRIPLFREIDAQLRRTGKKLHVIFGAKTEPRRQWKMDSNAFGFEHTFLPVKSAYSTSKESLRLTYPNLYQRLDALDPVAIIGNGFSVAVLKLAIRSMWNRVPFIIWSGAISSASQRESVLQKIFRRALVFRSSGFVAYGSKARDYLIALGAKSDAIEIGINTVDTEYYRRGLDTVRFVESQYPIRLLYVGNLTAGKKVERAIELLRRCIDSDIDARLDIVGDGPMRQPLNELVENLKLTNHVAFHGYQEKEGVRDMMHASDIFLFPSEYDVWGLVLIEAMSAGLVCLSSVQSGATIDLIKEGVNGYAVDFNDADYCTKLVINLNHDRALLTRMKEEAIKSSVEQLSIGNSAAGFVRAIGYSYA